jgi:hypothetical protein
MKLILTLILFALVTGVQAEPLTISGPSWTWANYDGCTAREYECVICGKTLFEYQKAREGWATSGMILAVGTCEHDEGKTLSIPWSIKVCRDCYDKYLPEIKVYQEKLEAWVKVTREHARGERLINEEKRRVQKLRDVQQEVDRLQRRLKELQK